MPPKTDEEKAADRERREKLDAVFMELAPKFIEHFGNLGELITIRHVLQEAVAELRDLRDVLESKLESIAIMLGGPKR